jgi:ATP-dependent DNA helicase HFM1/MER3
LVIILFILELAMTRLFIKHKSVETKKRNHKVIYMAPIKALCQEKFEIWKPKFSKLGLICKELTGDSQNVTFKDVSDSDIMYLFL